MWDSSSDIMLNSNLNKNKIKTIVHNFDIKNTEVNLNNILIITGNFNIRDNN